jgi:general secretion pathway protein L
LAVVQSVVRLVHVGTAAEALGLTLDEIGFVESSEEKADSPPPILLRRDMLRNQGGWVHRSAVGLAVMALLLASTILGTRYYRQQSTLDSLDGEIAATSVEAKKVLGLVDKLQQEQTLLARLRAKRDEPSLVDVWQEATTILPVHTWLSELRLSEAPEGRHVVMTGFSSAAAGLVGVIERSKIFAEAALVGSVSMDPSEGKERFTMQMKLKPPPATKTVSR